MSSNFDFPYLVILLLCEFVVKEFGIFFFWFQGLKVNLILTDYSMPGMTGYELLKKIKVG